MEIREATPDDGPELARFLMENPMSVEKDFVMDRTPDFNSLLSLRGDHRSFCAYSGGELAGMVTALWDDRLDQGNPVRAGEITDLRVAKRYRGHWVTLHLLEAGKAALEGAGVDWAFCLIGDRNETAKKLVRGRGRLLALRPLTRYLSVHYVAIRVPSALSGTGFGIRAADATVDDIRYIEEGLMGVAEAHRVAPASIAPWPDPTQRHKAWLAIGTNGQALGGLVVWDGYDVRRIRVMHYSGMDRLLKGMTHAASRLHLATALPPAGDALRLWASRAFWTDGERPDVARALIATTLRAAVAQGAHVVQLNLPKGDCLIDALPRFPHSSYWSTLYGVKRDKEVEHRDSRPFHVELAMV